MGSLMPPEDEIQLAQTTDSAICELAARHFQLELFELAVKQNVIICLGTGTGKTLVSALLIKELLHQTRERLENGGRRSVFLAPTVPLVQQQTAYLKRHLNASVASFVGAMRVDDWTGTQWWQEFDQHNVLVMTPTILNNILNANFVSMANINLLIFDECHCATGKDPYVQIMQNHYMSTHPTSRPRILGLTASVLNKRVKTSEMMDRIEELECKLGANLVTAFSAVDYITRPREIIVKYAHRNERSLVTPHPKATAWVNEMLAAVGPFGCLEVIRRKIRQLNNMILSEIAAEHRLREAKELRQAYEIAERTICSWGAPLEDASEKAWKLMNVLEAFRTVEEELCGIVFTVERSTVFALCSWIKEMIKKYPERWGFLRCDFVIGQHGMTLYGPEYSESFQVPDSDSIRHQERVLQDFRKRQLNLLIATSVIEEGVDIPACNLVLRYDPPKNMRSYVQSRGRARGNPSMYLLFADVKAAPVIHQDIFQFKNIEFQLLRYCNAHHRTPIESSQMFLHLYNRSHLSNIYSKVHPNNCRAMITPFAARQILQWYCDSLGSDRYTLQKPDYVYETAASPSKLVRCGIHLPRQSPLQMIVYGAWEESSLTARTSAAINVLSRLYSLGELTEHLLPRKRKVALEVTIDEVSAEVAQLFRTGPATQTNLILCPRRMSSSLQPTSVPELPVDLILYKFSLRIDKLNDPDHLDSRYMDPADEPICMGLLVKIALPECVPEFPVYTRAGTEMVAVDKCRMITLHESQYKLCAEFNRYLFDEVLRIPSMVFDEETIPVIVPVLDNNVHWDLMELAVSDVSEIPLSEDSVVNIEATELGPNVHEKRCYVEKIFSKDDGIVRVVPKRVQKRLEMIFPRHEDRLGNVSLRTTKRKPRSLAPRLASKCKVEKLSAPVWNKATSVPSIIYRLNRLLVADELRVAIVRGSGLGRLRPLTPWKPLEMERQAGHRRTRLEMKSDIVRSMKFNVPTDLENCDGPSPADILKALTPLYITDIVDSERLEVIGDSFLKIAVTLHFYQELISSNEGELTTRRCRIISNMSLLQHAVPKGIHEMVECVKFRVRVNFVPPGAQERALLSGRCLKADVAEMSRRSQYYKSKMCADSVEALIGVYLEKCGPVGALEYLRWLDIPLGRYNEGDFLDRFELPLPEPLREDKKADVERWRKEILTVQETLGYIFQNELLVLEAITHKSYRYNRLTRSYERLEFLGDAVIDYLISKYIYTADSDLNPGQLTDVRASLVSNNTFAAIIVDNKLHTVMQHHSPLLLKLTNRFVEYRETEKRIDILAHMMGEEDEDLEDLEQVDIPKPLGDLMESLMGAVFLDSGKDLDVVWAVLVRLMTEEFMRDAVINVRVNPVRQLSETYPDSVEFTEPKINDDARTTMTLTVQDKVFEATARNKKVAKVVLAKKALRYFQREKEKQDLVASW
ncbi:endoribonuclease Dicer [Galendromus occidentalis]|uniref:Endoribonuclease Dicer n=1 Tax=Galendromus occidentalis TaxID=34638 RepID=A0AAJ7SHR3_9ACAR|nr:endoribonuclease Dicer [Galendromus occidentalis]